MVVESAVLLVNIENLELVGWYGLRYLAVYRFNDGSFICFLPLGTLHMFESPLIFKN